MHRRGFTILELLVVMAIIGILAAIGLGAYPGVQQKARDARRKSDLENIARALEMWYGDSNTNPREYPAPGTEFNFNMALESNGELYMQLVPEDRRFPGSAYVYDRPDVDQFALYARIENQEDSAIARDGTDDPSIYQGMENACGTGNPGCNYFVGSPNATVPPVVDVP